MDIQAVIVALIVVPSVVYAAWAVMPMSLRVLTARGLLHARWPARVTAWLNKTAAGASGCGCSGCDNNPSVSALKRGKPGAGRSTATSPVQVVRIHPRTRR